MVLPMLAAVTVGLVWLISVGAAQVRAIDAARETARGLARGDDRAVAIERGVRVGVAGTRISVRADGDRVVATAQGSVAGPGGLFGFLPEVRVHAEAIAALEAPASAASGGR